MRTPLFYLQSKEAELKNDHLIPMSGLKWELADIWQNILKYLHWTYVYHQKNVQ